MKKSKYLALLIAVLFIFGFTFSAKAESAVAQNDSSAIIVDSGSNAAVEDDDGNPSFAFTLIEKLAKLDGLKPIMFITAILLVVILAVIIYAVFGKKSSESIPVERKKMSPLRALVFGALCMSLSFVLSYIKLFSMPYGGAVTLCSMLPIMLYASWAGYRYGFLMAFGYGLLQCLQDWYVIHPIQFLLDYVLGFTALGLMAFFKSDKTRPLGILVAGFARMLCSIISGAIFFAEYAPEGMNPWVYTIIYNVLSIGVDTIICLIVYTVPTVVRKTFTTLRDIALNG